MKRHQLTAQPRTVVGHKVKQLRAAGQLPATVYGKGIPSVSVTVDTKIFTKLLGEVGETGLTDLTVGKEVRPVLVSNVQRDPVRGEFLHVEFRQVNLKEKVKANIPVEFTGESPAIAQNLGVLVNVTDEIEVEALPDHLPDHIQVDVSLLTEVGSEITVGSIKLSSDVSILTDAEQVVVKIGELTKEEVETPKAPAEGETVPATPEAAPAAEEKKE